MNKQKRLTATFILPVLLFVLPSPARAQLGAIAGLGEDKVASTLFTMTGESLIGEGKGVLAAAYLYTRLTRSFGDKIEDLTPAFTAADPNRAIEVGSTLYVVGYGITDRFNFQLLVPFSAARFKATDTTTGLVEEEEHHGIGNTAVAFKYQFARSPRLAVQLSVSAPSGYEPTVATDATKGGLDLAWSGRTAFADFHLQAGYQYAGENRNRRNLSDSAVANLAIARYFGPTFVASLELNGFRTGGNLDPKLDSPPQSSLDLTPGFKVQVKDNLIIASAAKIRLKNDLALGYDASYLFVAGYTF